MKTLTRVLLTGLLIALPSSLAAQSNGFGSDARSRLIVFLAYAAAWVVIGAWVYRIGAKVKRLSIQQEPKG